MWRSGKLLGAKRLEVDGSKNIPRGIDGRPAPRPSQRPHVTQSNIGELPWGSSAPTRSSAYLGTSRRPGPAKLLGGNRLADLGTYLPVYGIIWYRGGPGTLSAGPPASTTTGQEVRREGGTMRLPANLAQERRREVRGKGGWIRYREPRLRLSCDLVEPTDEHAL